MGNLFKTSLLAMRYIINNSGRTSWDLEILTGISRQSFDRWMRENKNIRKSSLFKVAKKLNYDVTISNEGFKIIKKTSEIEPSKNNESLIEYIELQKAHIKLLNEKIDFLENK